MNTVKLIARAKDGSHFMRFESITHAESEGYSADCIGHCLKGRAHHHAGYTWEEEGKGKPKPTASPRMLEVAKYRNAGLKNRQIAALMGITEKTVRCYAGRLVQAGMIESQAIKGTWND
ncbi:hypothetical protein [Aeromonas phage 32]|nr:hypothetical protein [Aeromonas phage 32]